MMKHNAYLLKNWMNEDAGDLADYDRSESAEYCLSPKRGCFKVGCRLVFDARLTFAIKLNE